MARLGLVPRIIGLFLLLIVLAAGMVVWFDFLGIIDASGIINPVAGLFGAARPTVNADNPVLLDEIRIRSMEDALDLRYQDLLNQSDELAKRDQEVSQKSAELVEREKAIDDREKSFNLTRETYDDVSRNRIENSIQLTSMKPEDAVKILANYDEQELVDILRVTEELARKEGKKSLVSVWLSQLPADKVARVQSLMTNKPSGE